MEPREEAPDAARRWRSFEEGHAALYASLKGYQREGVRAGLSLGGRLLLADDMARAHHSLRPRQHIRREHVQIIPGAKTPTVRMLHATGSASGRAAHRRCAL